MNSRLNNELDYKYFDITSKDSTGSNLLKIRFIYEDNTLSMAIYNLTIDGSTNKLPFRFLFYSKHQTSNDIQYSFRHGKYDSIILTVDQYNANAEFLYYRSDKKYKFGLINEKIIVEEVN